MFESDHNLCPGVIFLYVIIYIRSSLFKFSTIWSFWSIIVQTLPYQQIFSQSLILLLHSIEINNLNQNILLETVMNISSAKYQHGHLYPFPLRAPSCSSFCRTFLWVTGPSLIFRFRCIGGGADRRGVFRFNPLTLPFWVTMETLLDISYLQSETFDKIAIGSFYRFGRIMKKL